MAYITFLGRRKAAGVYLLKGPTTIGRSLDCDVYVPDVFVSRSHCRIERDENSWRVVDLSSRNGIWCQGQRHNKHLLKPGDTVEIGTVAFTFNGGQPAGLSTPAPFGMGLVVTELMDTVCTEGIRPWEYSKRQHGRKAQWLARAERMRNSSDEDIPLLPAPLVEAWVEEEWAELDVELQIAQAQFSLENWQAPIFNPAAAQREAQLKVADLPSAAPAPAMDSIDEEVELMVSSQSQRHRPAAAPRVETLDGVEFIPYTWRDRLLDQLKDRCMTLLGHARLNPQWAIAMVIGIGILTYAVARIAPVSSGPHYYIPEETKLASK